MKFRRIEDRTLTFLMGTSLAQRGEEAPVEERDPLHWRVYEWRSGADLEQKKVNEIGTDVDSGVFLLDFGGDEALLIAGAGVRRLPRGLESKDLLQRAATGAAAWAQERVRMWRWLRLPDQLSVFADKLNRADEVSHVCEVLSSGVVEVVGGYQALLLLRQRGGGTLYSPDTRLAVCDNGSLPLLAHSRLTIPSHPRLWRPGIVTASEARAEIGGPFSLLSPLFVEFGASVIAHMPIGEEGVVMLVERRRDRVFQAEDWALFQSLVSQAEGALRRVYSLEEVQTLSLTDPLTGLANRRRMEVVMEHAWAAARRGRPLAVVLVDLDRFKQINDQNGHLAGDRILQLVAGVLQEEARGSDLVVRYGGDEFLVLLPGETKQGASALVERLHSRLSGRVEFSAGIAEYHSGLRAPSELLEAADQQLYAMKRQISHPHHA